MRGNDLCLYRNILNGTGDGYHASLYYFAQGQKAGVQIPLAFSVAGMTNPSYIRVQSAIFSYQSVVATDYGLVLGQVMHGFWVIPWKDIDAYRTKSTPGEIVALPDAPVSAPVPTVPAAPAEPPAPPVVSFPNAPTVRTIETVPSFHRLPATTAPPVVTPPPGGPVSPPSSDRD